ncbi:peptidase M76 family-domain-containing protein [Tribonema minus]|uniref:Mitochondrial inner membrane protease ATP23 n=1 Tax=Tribonema minus TaxID=303371 RepID=A0A836CIN8_9STRA|nr:peptidase M76 family-domain-containing protein [Tribonema minus]
MAVPEQQEASVATAATAVAGDRRQRTAAASAGTAAGSQSWTCDSCNSALQSVLQRDRPRRLMQAIRAGMQANKENGRSNDCGSDCRLCPDQGPEGGARAFLETPPATLVLCVNRMRGAEEMEEALVHELVHAFDYCASNRNLFSCKSLAHSEVRAAREAECHYLYSQSPPLLEGTWRDCIRNSAARSTAQLFPGNGGRCVDSVFTAAMADTVPLHTPPVRGRLAVMYESWQRQLSSQLGSAETTAAKGGGGDDSGKRSETQGASGMAGLPPPRPSQACDDHQATNDTP